MHGDNTFCKAKGPTTYVEEVIPCVAGLPKSTTMVLSQPRGLTKEQAGTKTSSRRVLLPPTLRVGAVRHGSWCPPRDTARRAE
eukprot:558057-Amphidinium_carterae.1